MMRRLAKNMMELGATTGPSALARRRNRDSIAVLAYHNVVPEAEAGRGDASLHLPLSRFIAQIERLSRTHDIVDIESVQDAPSGHRPRAIITFDDAYCGAVTFALPELVRRGIPATVFVAPGLLSARSTWWDDVAAAGLFSDVVRDDALERLAGRSDVVRLRVLHERQAPVLPASYAIAGRDELEEHCGTGIRVGSHTWGHEYLPALAEAEVEANLRRTLQWLDAYAGATTRWLALPYGGGSPVVSNVALELGHIGVLRIEGGLWNGTDRAHTPRINVPAGMSVRGLELRTSGLR